MRVLSEDGFLQKLRQSVRGAPDPANVDIKSLIVKQMKMRQVEK